MSLLDESGQRAVSYAYDDFGKTDIKPAAGNTDRRGETNEICYTDSVYDRITEQYYLNARYYNPDAGNFLTQDSYRGTPEDENTWNLYAYCAGNLVNYTDPSGHFVIAIPLVIGAGSFLISAGVTIDFSQKLYHAYQDAKTFVSKIEVKSTKPISSPKKLEAPKIKEKAKAKPKAGPAPKILQAKAGDGISEHTKNKRKSTHDKHTKRRPGNEKKKRKSSWKKRK